MSVAAWKSIPVPASVIFLLIITLTGIFAPAIAPHDPFRGSLRERNLPPAWLEGGSTQHLLGTDFLGRDIFSRFIHGARVTLLTSLVPVLVAGFIGIGIGVIAGYFSGRLGILDFRLTDLPLLLFAILPLLLAEFSVPLAVLLAPVAIGGPGLLRLVIFSTVLASVIFTHQVWRETLRAKEAESVSQAREAGVSHFRVIIRHILPRVLTALPILVPSLALFLMVYAIVLGPTLSFLGLGVPPPTPAWGLMISEGRERLASAWWLPVFPALAILLTTFSLALLAVHFRDRSHLVLRNSAMAVRPAVLLAALLVTLLVLGMAVGPGLAQGFLYPLAWLLGAAIVWRGWQHYRLPGARTVFLGFVLLLASSLLGSIRNLFFFAAVLLGAGDLTKLLYSPQGFSLFGPVTELPGLSETPYERVFNIYLVPAIGLPALVGALLVAYGLWSLGKGVPQRSAGGR